ncbi:MAG: hypothetical protein ACJASX_002470 [Limisphaerales bacterium]|jgi:hypothetical protein
MPILLKTYCSATAWLASKDVRFAFWCVFHSVGFEAGRVICHADDDAND